MKKYVVLLTIAALSLFNQGQAQTIEFSFTATNDTNWIKLDSISVRNVTRGGDTLLIYPDTILVLEQATGLRDLTFTSVNFEITACYPNPLNEKAVLQVFVPERDQVEIRITDVLSKQTMVQKVMLDAGLHSFTISPGGKGVHIIIARWRGKSDHRALISRGEYSSPDCRLISQNEQGTSLKNSIIPESVSFPYYSGDILWYTGFSQTKSVGIIDIPIASSFYSFRFIPPQPCPGIPTLVYDGQVYHTVQVGSQCWLRENLNVGAMISGDMDMTNNGVIEKYCYDNDPVNCSFYGGLYQWDEAMQYTTQPGTQGICPPGWHIPANEEQWLFTDFLGGQLIAGGKMKEAGTIRWESPNMGATNESGFTALPAGSLDPLNHNFSNLNSASVLWSSSETSSPTLVWHRGLSSYEAKCSDGFSNKSSGYSVRCIKDN